MAFKVQFKFTRSHLKEIREQLGLETSLKDCSELFQDFMDEVYIPAAADQFDAEGLPDTWHPLSPKYALRKARLIGHTQILVYSGDLRDSLGSKEGNEYSVRKIGPRRMLFGTTRPFAAVHQYGSNRKMNIPSRPYLVLLDDDYERMLDMSIDWLAKIGRYEQ